MWGETRPSYSRRGSERVSRQAGRVSALAAGRGCYNHRSVISARARHSRPAAGAAGGTQLNLDLSGSPSGPRAFGPFKVLHQIGIGVLGPVYRAQDREHFVAIKAFRLDIPPETADDLGEALRALVSAATGIDGLVLPVGAGVEGGTPWLAMPHVALPTLDTRLRDEGAPDLDRARADPARARRGGRCGARARPAPREPAPARRVRGRKRWCAGHRVRCRLGRCSPWASARRCAGPTRRPSSSPIRRRRWYTRRPPITTRWARWRSSF